MSATEVENFINAENVEWAYAQACKAQQEGRQSFARTGWRAAQSRDPRLLKVLEKAAEIVTAMDENQRGRTRRAAERLCDQIETTETQLWREAYRMCDQGTPIRNFEWIYGAAALLCGYGG
jgi:t-SNARE complex subunit (syntaxin)